MTAKNPYKILSRHPNTDFPVRLVRYTEGEKGGLVTLQRSYWRGGQEVWDDYPLNFQGRREWTGWLLQLAAKGSEESDGGKKKAQPQGKQRSPGRPRKQEEAGPQVPSIPTIG